MKIEKKQVPFPGVSKNTSDAKEIPIVLKVKPYPEMSEKIK